MAELPTASWLAELTRFDPPKGIESPPDWDDAVQLLAQHGLAPIAAYNLQYRMPHASAPDWAKDLLLGYFQGVLNDNVFKLVTLKQLVGNLAGVSVLLLDGASFAEALYPHIAFRTIPEVRLLVRPEDVQRIVEAVREEKFVPVELDEPDPDQPAVTLYNDKFYVKLYSSIVPKGDAGLFERAVSVKAYGASVSRLSAEDALVVHSLSLARRAFAVPMVQLVDLRELVRGDSGMGGRHGPGSPIDAEELKARAKEMGAERALWAALELVADLFAEVAVKARALQPDLGKPTRMLIETTVLGPARDITRTRQLRGMEKLVQLLLG